MRTALLLSLLLVGCGSRPGELVAGSGQARLHAPIGIGTAGFGPFGVSSNSPFSEIFPATTAVHGHPDVKAVVLSRGEGFEAILVRVDLVATFPGLRAGVLDRLEERYDRRFDDALIISATHTHSGPGRILDGGGAFELIADRFLPEHYDRMVDAIVDAIGQGLEAQGPARIGHVVTSSAGASDRRCEDGETVDTDQLMVMGVEIDGELDSLLLGFAVHGTTVGIEELTLTGDVSGAIEDNVEGRFDRPVMAAVFNGWGGDVSPDAPEWVAREGATEIVGDWARQDAIAAAVGDAVEAVATDLPWEEEPEVRLETRRVPINRQVLGYEGNDFPYPAGAVFCGIGREFDCDPSTTEDDLANRCTAFQAEYPAPGAASFTAGQIGDLAIITFPGEPVSRVGEAVAAGMRDSGAGDVWFLGYAQEYTGYSLLEEDWWQGGYEATGTLWGPKQGDYLAAQAVQIWTSVNAEEKAPEDQPEADRAFDVSSYDPYVAERAIEPGKSLGDASIELPTSGMVTWTFHGLDPWLGAPRVTLLDASGEPVLFGGRPVDSDGYAMGLALEVQPSYRDDAPEGRSFLYTVSLPVTRPLAGMAPDLRGVHGLSAELPDGTVVSGPTITISE